MTAHSFPFGLYGITPEWHDGDRLRRAVSQACKGGMRVLQWRQKTMPADQVRPIAASLRDICGEAGVLFIVNDDWKLALELDADGVHLGRHDAAVATVRAHAQQQNRPQLLVGVSCYDSLDLAAAAMQDKPDYLAFGALFPSMVKPDAVRAPLSLFQDAKALRKPGYMPALVGIGGINRQNARLAVEAGADSIAVITGLFEETDILGAAQWYSTLFNEHAASS